LTILISLRDNFTLFFVTIQSAIHFVAAESIWNFWQFLKSYLHGNMAMGIYIPIAYCQMVILPNP
jgi:hypothetical protein